jgi:DNA-binding PadR family transcriptional regulator
MPKPSQTSPPLREFELVVMLAVLHLDGDGYPLTIRDAIEERTGRAVSRSAVFITLERLERNGFVASKLADSTPVRGGRAKRIFSSTGRGVRAARASLGLVSAMTAGLESVLEP